jgi:hypothetical protein
MQKNSKIITAKIGMQMKKFKNSDNAVVGIVAAFLIIGLIIAVLSLLQTQYVPKWMEEKEADHMTQVADQFAQLKYAIDTHTVNQKLNTPISTSIPLGSKEMPYLMSVRAFGQLEIINNAGGLSIENESGPFNFALGSIKYSSANGYFINQNFVYEYGGVILSQSDGNTMKIRPSIFVIFQENVTITFNLINISTIGGKRAISGFDTYPIQTEYLGLGDSSEITDISKFDLTTSYTDAWYSLLNNTLTNAGLKYGTNYSMIKTDKSVTVIFTTESITVNVDIKIVNIGAQIAPGWIINTKS